MPRAYRDDRDRPVPARRRRLPSGVTWRPDTADEPERIGGPLDRLAKRISGTTAGGVGAVFARWEEIVGAAAAAHATPVKLTGTTLQVQVDHGAWSTQLTALETTVLARIAEVAGPGVVAKVRYRVGA